MPSVGFVVGNGLSREGFDLERLRGYGTIVGCNRLHETFEPNYLVGIDTRMHPALHEAVKKPHSWKWINRDVDNNEHVITVDGVTVVKVEDINNGFINNAGLCATAFLAEILRVDEIYMIGIDWFLPVEGRVNNIFEETGNRRQSKGIEKVWNTIPERNPGTKFHRVGAIPEADRAFYYERLEGFKFMTDFETMPIGKEI